MKKHMICYIVLVFIIGALLTFLSKKPKEKIVTQTVTKTQIVTKIRYIVKIKKVHDNIITNRVTDITKKDGTTEHIVTNVVDKSQSTTKDSSKVELKVAAIAQTQTQTIVKSQSNYLIGATYQTQLTNPTFTPDPTKVTGVFGVRVFDLPVFAMVGLQGDMKTVSAGILLEL